MNLKEKNYPIPTQWLRGAKAEEYVVTINNDNLMTKHNIPFGARMLIRLQETPIHNQIYLFRYEGKEYVRLYKDLTNIVCLKCDDSNYDIYIPKEDIKKLRIIGRIETSIFNL